MVLEKKDMKQFWVEGIDILQRAHWGNYVCLQAGSESQASVDHGGEELERKQRKSWSELGAMQKEKRGK